uniref:DNA2/NAM7 helicase helicase domain-containing protein n=1 Tax=Romanomermis culicivorax TaxID=13658 RepID=A0A915I4W3_ROMCU
MQAVHLSEKKYISIIQGPPGTGKMWTATTIVQGAFAVDNSKILTTAPSNTAVDNFIWDLLKSVKNNPDENQ